MKKTLKDVQSLYNSVLEVSNACDNRREESRINTMKKLEKIRIEKTLGKGADNFEEKAQSFYLLVCKDLDHKIDMLDYRDNDLPF